MINLTIDLARLQVFLFVFVRVAAILMTLPVFSGSAVPNQLKIGLAMAVALVLLPLVPPTVPPMVSGILGMGLAIFREITLGAAVGLAVKIAFAGIQLAGQMAGYQMGMAIANVMDPATSAQVPILAQFNNLFAVLIFLLINAHHWFIRALVESFERLPLADFGFSSGFFQYLIQLSAEMFVVAVKIGAPVIVALLLTSVALGLVARTVPQMNIFIVAMPLKIVIGLIFLGISLPHMSAFLSGVFEHLYRSVVNIVALAV